MGEDYFFEQPKIKKKKGAVLYYRDNVEETIARHHGMIVDAYEILRKEDNTFARVKGVLQDFSIWYKKDHKRAFREGKEKEKQLGAFQLPNMHVIDVKRLEEKVYELTQDPSVQLIQGFEDRTMKCREKESFEDLKAYFSHNN